MTPDELRSLADEATPGPWKWRTDGSENDSVPPAKGYVGDLEHPAGYPPVIWAHGMHTEGYVVAENFADARLIALAPGLARLCAELGEALIPARDLLANDLEREEDGGYRAVLEVVDEALAKLSELKL